MPTLPEFSDNPLKTREDVVHVSKALITPLLPYFSAAKARVCISEAIGAQLDETKTNAREQKTVIIYLLIISIMMRYQRSGIPPDPHGSALKTKSS